MKPKFLRSINKHFSKKPYGADFRRIGGKKNSRWMFSSFPFSEKKHLMLCDSYVEKVSILTNTRQIHMTPEQQHMKECHGDLWVESANLTFWPSQPSAAKTVLALFLMPIFSFVAFFLGGMWNTMVFLVHSRAQIDGVVSVTSFFHFRCEMETRYRVFFRPCKIQWKRTYTK